MLQYCLFYIVNIFKLMVIARSSGAIPKDGENCDKNHKNVTLNRLKQSCAGLII